MLLCRKLHIAESLSFEHRVLPLKMAGKEKGKASVKDDRFASVEFDPRFQRFPRAKSKIRVDERFKGVRMR